MAPRAVGFQKTAWSWLSRSRQRLCRPRMRRCWGLRLAARDWRASGSGATTIRSLSRRAWGGKGLLSSAGQPLAWSTRNGPPCPSGPQICHQGRVWRCQSASPRPSPKRCCHSCGRRRPGVAGKLCTRLAPVISCSRPSALGLGQRQRANEGNRMSSAISELVQGNGGLGPVARAMVRPESSGLAGSWARFVKRPKAVGQRQVRRLIPYRRFAWR